MTDNNTRAMALAAASVLGLSVGMISPTANADQVKDQTTTQIKGETTQIKGESNQIKLDGTSRQGKFIANDHKTPTGSNQIKWNGVSDQHKTATPSPNLNPQPEPPMQNGGITPPSPGLNPQPEPPKPTGQSKPK